MPSGFVTPAAGGGSQTVQCVRFPIAFDTPGLVPESFPIIAIDLDAQTVTVAGDRTAAFAPGVPFSAILEGGAASPTTVVTATFAGGETIVAGLGTFLGEGITYVAAVVAVGLPIYTPTVGDIMFAMDVDPDVRGTISQAWNGSTPALHLSTETGRQAQSTFNTPIVLTAIDDDLFGTGTTFVNLHGFAASSTHRLLRFAAADPLLVWIDDGNGLDPGATQGAGELVFLILVAA